MEGNLENIKGTGIAIDPVSGVCTTWYNTYAHTIQMLSKVHRNVHPEIRFYKGDIHPIITEKGQDYPKIKASIIFQGGIPI